MYLQYPENYLPATAEIKLLGSKRKRTLKDADEDNEQSVKNDKTFEKNTEKCPGKKVKIQYELEKEAAKLITADVANKKYWDDCKELLQKGKNVNITLIF